MGGCLLIEWLIRLSLASPAVRSYIRAYVRDLVEAYPQITGFRPDWPEYPCYKLDEAFQDFGPHVMNWGTDHGYKMCPMKDAVGKFYKTIHGELKNEDLWDWASPDFGRFAFVNFLRGNPHIAEWFRLKADLSVDILREWRGSDLQHMVVMKKNCQLILSCQFYTLLTALTLVVLRNFVTLFLRNFIRCTGLQWLNFGVE